MAPNCIPQCPGVNCKWGVGEVKASEPWLTCPHFGLHALFWGIGKEIKTEETKNSLSGTGEMAQWVRAPLSG